MQQPGCDVRRPSCRSFGLDLHVHLLEFRCTHTVGVCAIGIVGDEVIAGLEVGRTLLGFNVAATADLLGIDK